MRRVLKPFSLKNEDSFRERKKNNKISIFILNIIRNEIRVIDVIFILLLKGYNFIRKRKFKFQLIILLILLFTDLF